MESLGRPQVIDPEERNGSHFSPASFLCSNCLGSGGALFISSPLQGMAMLNYAYARYNLKLPKDRGGLMCIRGPFGTNFPMEKDAWPKYLLIAGGLALHR
jgi:hypothetical protein